MGVIVMNMNKKDEVDEYLSSYFSEGGKIEGIGESDFCEITNILLNSAKFDAPDRYYVNGQVVYLFEHFQIDSTKHDKHGSGFASAQSILRRKAECYFQQYPNETISLSSQLYIENSSRHYLSILRKTFDHHYGQIGSYIQNVKKAERLFGSNYTFKIAFIIEDASPLGTFRSDTCRMVMPFLVKEFMDHLRSLALIDFLFCSGHIGSNACTYIIPKEMFNSFEKDEYEILKTGLIDDSLFSINVQVASKKTGGE